MLAFLPIYCIYEVAMGLRFLTFLCHPFSLFFLRLLFFFFVSSFLPFTLRHASCVEAPLLSTRCWNRLNCLDWIDGMGWHGSMEIYHINVELTLTLTLTF